MIKQENGKWCLYTKDGSRKIGEYDTEAEAQVHMGKSRNAEDARHLHLRGAVGAVRTEMWRGREHLVVPVVALQEGVIHPVNAPSAEFVSADVLTRSYQKWQGHTLVVGHPVKSGKQCSAYEDDVVGKTDFGFIRSSEMKGNRLVLETLVDPKRLEMLGEHQLLADLRAGNVAEVSVGAFVRTNAKESEYRGKKYKGEWLEAEPDHLAFLPRGRGACSVEMGCGAHRAASHLVTAEGIEPIEEELTIAETVSAKLKEMLSALQGKEQPLKAACGCQHKENDMDKKERAAALAKSEHCAIKDVKTLETLPDDQFTALETQVKQFGDLKAAADKATEDKKAADAKAAADLKAAEDAKAATLKAAEDAKKTSDERFTAMEARLAKAEANQVTPEMQAIVAEKKAEDEATKTALIANLKAAADKAGFTEEDLKTKSIPELKKLAAMAQLPVADYSGRGIPRVSGAAQPDFTPPNPYERDIKALQGKTTVN